MYDMTCGCLVLAAGKGTRMYSSQPKVLVEILGEPMLWYVFEALIPLFKDRLWTVVGYMHNDVKRAFVGQDLHWILQARQLGTGHALQMAWPVLDIVGLTRLVVVNGDTPLLSGDRILRFIEKSIAADADLSFMTMLMDDPGAAFGRIVRQNQRVVAIVEAKDYNVQHWEPETSEINVGVYCLKLATMATLLTKLTNYNKSGEFYITDLVGLAVAENLCVVDINCGDNLYLLGINSPAELIAAEEFKREIIIREWLQYGVTIRAPDTVRIGPRVRLERGCEVTGPCELYGSTTVAAGARIASHTVLLNSTVGKGAEVKSFSHLEGARIEVGTKVGPFARLRPGTLLQDGAAVGNFVEVKKSTLGPGSKAGHLTYLGDARIGAEVNIGAGTITCNYDGKRKHETHIEDQAFIGSNAALVAPVRIGEGSLVGAGSVITKDVPAGILAVGRGRQVNLQRKP
ncbi:UDP-N-acetylglucosamine pyrophosphorylase / Glucosamine-1-phosphate N-acetyltransferase [Desulfovibrionales bacterium]